mmetsp:Transcript_32813/g.46614  ORF Transcript_32813/g.46614 Transcript_32813/m.46614 type:complete len:436 (+) Transcript_32813:105-1412(+)
MCRTATAKGNDNKSIDAVAAVQHKSANGLGDGEEWIAKLDLKAFAKDVYDLGKTFEKQQGPADVRHLNKMVWWSNGCGLLGFFTLGFTPLSAIFISLFTFSRWTMIAHHTCHGGYDKCHPNRTRWTRFKFALGSLWRRLCDWFDWMMPEAWNIEHNNRHHYNLSEVDDPDLLEENLADVRNSDASYFVKYMIVAGAMLTWKWFYYSPNTYKELKLAKMRREGKTIPSDAAACVTMRSILEGSNRFYTAWEFFSVVIGPYMLIHFLLFPLPYLGLEMYFGMEGLYLKAITNLIIAEMMTNVHGFVAVVTNHAGNDMYRFRNSCRPYSGSFYLRQVLASVDFDMGNDATDFMHGWLNYQIEHHLWPSLSMLSYQRSAPQVRALCKKHGVPYIKENVFIRLKKTIDIMTGKENMKWFPEQYEAEFLKIDAAMEKEKKG